MAEWQPHSLVPVTCKTCGAQGFDDPNAGLLFGVCADCMRRKLDELSMLVESGAIRNQDDLIEALIDLGVERRVALREIQRAHAR